MGCGASKEATPVVAAAHASSNGAQIGKTTGEAKPSHASEAKKDTAAAELENQRQQLESLSQVIQNMPLHGAENRRKDFAIRPGYSSGASSFADSDMEEDDTEFSADASKREVRRGHRRVGSTGGLSTHSKHSEILALGELRDELLSQGDLTKTVVRIETPFGRPIEEIYDGVHDGPVLGSGVSGIVRLVTHKATGVKYAVKCLDICLINSVEGLRQLRDEIFIMCQLDHPNIVRIEEVYESTNEIYIVQELCLGGDLFDRLDEQDDFHYTEAQCARLVKQMLSSLRYLHSKGIIHRDLKLENFLFSSSKADSQLKMIDFGLSKHFEIGETHVEKVGTPYTVAPEIIQGKYDEKCDIWALGVITYLLLSGETPFGGLDGESLIMVKENIMRAQVCFEPKDVWDNISIDGKNFVKVLLNPDPAKRPNAKETQRDPWIQVWAKKDAKEGTPLNSKTLTALMTFKESSDMQKLLSEVLSFTLLPEQIEELREEFEKIDTEGGGEISLMALKRVLMENAESGDLGALTELEIEDIFDSIRVRKSEPTIRWHEFLAAGLSQARVDDRNLRLAFDRLDTQRKGFITFEDLEDVLGSSAAYEELEKMWLDTLQVCKARLDRITFAEFKLLMKGQPKEPIIPGPLGMLDNPSMSLGSSLGGTPLAAVPESQKPSETPDPFAGLEDLTEDQSENARDIFKKKRSHSYECKSSAWSEDSNSFTRADGRRSMMVPPSTAREIEEISRDSSISPLVANRQIYRKHREMRFAVLEASKQFDKKRNDSEYDGERPSLIMKRGAKTPLELADAHTRALFEKAAKRCGRSRVRSKRNKTVSDVTGMLAR